jgi:hypothetical protein
VIGPNNGLEDRIEGLFGHEHHRVWSGQPEPSASTVARVVAARPVHVDQRMATRGVPPCLPVRPDSCSSACARVWTVCEHRQALAVVLTELNHVQASSDPDDDFILATAVTGRADALVTGDTADVLFLQKIGHVRIMTARALLDLLEPPQRPRERKR